jgi:uncharacterized RDD family membrane protein YckC
MQPELDDVDPAAAAVAAASVAVDRTLTAPPGSVPPAAGAPAAGLAAGHQLGHFRVERQLGAGGMGEVYLATDLALDRPVAIKVLPEAVARDTARRDRLVREARAQARVVHPNVGHIYFIGEERGLLYVAMEYVAGETLAQRAASAPMAIDDALTAIRGAALGLREAHRAGFLHRDVKPSNLMLDAHGVLKVLDFGLAAGGAGAGISGPIEQTSLVGTPLYMAPEQARGEAIDVRADIYALGATLFHIVMGRPPFEAKTPDELRDLHASAPRPVVAIPTQARTTAALGELCARMMAPNAADRFASYEELLAAIDVLTASRTRPAGFWARGVAAVLDLCVVSLATAAAMLVAALVASGPNVVAAVYVMPALAIYHAVCVRRWGRTIGKALLELEVVRADTGERPTWAQAARRSAALFALPIAFAIGTAVVDKDTPVGFIVSYLNVACYVVLVGVLALAAAARHAKRAPWDRMSGTLVRYRASLPTAP